VQPVARGPNLTRELKVWKDPAFKANITVFKGYSQSSVGGQRVSNTQSLTHATVTRGPIWLCAFGPAVLHGCTPLP